MTLQDIIARFNYHITGGEPSLWPVFGANARYIDFKNSYVIFDSVDHTIYEIGCHPGNYGVEPASIFWVNQNYEVAHRKEQTSRNLTKKDFGEQVYSQEAMMRMCISAENNEEIDKDLLTIFDLDLPSDLLASLKVIADAKMISVERLVEQYVTEFANELPKKKKKKK